MKNLRIHQGALSSTELGQELCESLQDCSGNGQTDDTFRADGCICRCNPGFQGSDCSITTTTSTTTTTTTAADTNCNDDHLLARMKEYYNAMDANELEALTDTNLICRKGFADNWDFSYDATVVHGVGWTEATCKDAALNAGHAGWYFDWSHHWRGWCRFIIDAAQVQHRISSKDVRWIDWPTSHSCIDLTKLSSNRRLSEGFMV